LRRGGRRDDRRLQPRGPGPQGRRPARGKRPGVGPDGRPFRRRPHRRLPGKHDAEALGPEGTRDRLWAGRAFDRDRPRDEERDQESPEPPAQRRGQGLVAERRDRNRNQNLARVTAAGRSLNMDPNTPAPPPPPAAYPP